MRIINVTERDATHGPVVLQLKKVVVYKYKKKEENISVWKPQGLLEEPQLSTRDTEGYTEASYLLTHNRR